MAFFSKISSFISQTILYSVLYLFPLKSILHLGELPSGSISSPSCLYSSSRRFSQIVQGKQPVCKHITVNKTVYVQEYEFPNQKFLPDATILSILKWRSMYFSRFLSLYILPTHTSASISNI